MLYPQRLKAAASARLCVETSALIDGYLRQRGQPPPRGCVLKLAEVDDIARTHPQPPPRGCVLKRRL